MQRRLRPHQPERHVHARPAASRAPPSAAPRTRSSRRRRGRRARRSGSSRRDRTASVRPREVVDPDRLDPLRSRPDDRRHGREPRDPRERRQRAAVAPKTKLGRRITWSRPEPRTASLHRPLRAGSTGRVSFVSSLVPSALISTKRAHARLARGGEQVRACPASSRARSRRACRRGSRRGGRLPCTPRPRREGSPGR